MVRLPAVLLVEGHDLGQVYVADVSSGGVYVQHPSPVLPVGTEVRLRFAPRRASEAPLEVGGRVAYRTEPGATHVHGPGFGVTISGAPADLAARLFGQAAPRAPSRPPVQQRPAPRAEPVPSGAPGAARARSVTSELELPVDDAAILVVDDDPAMGRTIARILGALGLGTLHETHAHAALETFQQHRRGLKLAIVDVLLPDMPGQDLMRKLRSEKPALPILAMSALLRAPAAQRGLLSSGANQFISKPFQQEELCQAVIALIEKGAVRSA